MRRFAWGDTGRLAAGVLAALLATLCASSPSRASCGHHVLSGHDSHPSSPGHAPRLDTPPPKADHNEQHAPCSGPHCSGQSRWPAPEPAAPVVVAVEDWASLPAGPLPLAPRFLFLVPDESDGLPLYGDLFVYRPPRSLSFDLI